jgi:quercetin dioxygenase-like cupin family protein
MSTRPTRDRPLSAAWAIVAVLVLATAACTQAADDPPEQAEAAPAAQGAAEEEEAPEGEAPDVEAPDDEAPDDEAPEPVVAEPLARVGFTDAVQAQFAVTVDGDELSASTDDASELMMVRLTLQPEARIGWHTHPGPALVAVEEGALAYVEHDCSERMYEAGSAFVDPGGGHVHSAYNASDGVTVLYATFLGVDDGPTQPAEDVDPDHCM